MEEISEHVDDDDDAIVRIAKNERKYRILAGLCLSEK